MKKSFLLTLTIGLSLSLFVACAKETKHPKGDKAAKTNVAADSTRTGGGWCGTNSGSHTGS